jgi:hypothetical protein
MKQKATIAGGWLGLLILLLGAAGLLGGLPVQAQSGCATPLPLPIGGEARVTFGGGGNRLRGAPGLGGAELTIVPEGGTFVVRGGPTCADGYNWGLGDVATGGAGCMAEGTPGDYWIAALAGAAQGEAVPLGEAAAQGEALPLGEGPLSPGGGLPEQPVPLAAEAEGGGASLAEMAAAAGLTPLADPPAAAPAGLLPLSLLTVDPDGTLGVYRDGRGWVSVTRADGNALAPALTRDSARPLVMLAASEMVRLVDIDTGAAVLEFNWADLTGQTDRYAGGAVPSLDYNAALVFVFQRVAAYAPYGLYRVGLGTLDIQELFPVGSWVGLQGPSGEPPRFAVTPTAIYPLQSNGTLGGAVLTYAQVASASEAPFLPALSWGADNRTAYVALPQPSAAGGSDFLVWRIGADGSVTELLGITGTDMSAVTGAVVSPDGLHIVLQLVNVLPDVQEWRIYNLSSGALEGRYPADFFGLTWTPDSLGFIARRSASGDGFGYYGLDGSTSSAYLPALPGLVEVAYLADGTVLFRQAGAGGQSQFGVQRPGMAAYSVRLNTTVTDAALGL